jgi:hypothetical protein
VVGESWKGDVILWSSCDGREAACCMLGSLTTDGVDAACASRGSNVGVPHEPCRKDHKSDLHSVANTARTQQPVHLPYSSRTGQGNRM